MKTLEEGSSIKNIGVSVSSLDEVFMRIENQAVMEAQGDFDKLTAQSVSKAKQSTRSRVTGVKE